MSTKKWKTKLKKLQTFKLKGKKTVNSTDVYSVIHYLIPLVDKLASQLRDFSLGRDAFLFGKLL